MLVTNTNMGKGKSPVTELDAFAEIVKALPHVLW
jgi:hypothetical protein